MVGPQSAPVEQRYEELGVRLFEPTPDAFEPLRADEGELQTYGYPQRPDAEEEPRRYMHWEQMVPRLSMVAPQFKDPPAEVAELTTDSSNWSGKVAFARWADAVKTVSGQWTVPHVVRAQPDSALYICATWVGIDGSAHLISPSALSKIERRVLPGDVEGPRPIGAAPPNETSFDVLQAGTTQAVWLGPTGTGSLHIGLQTQTFAWFEWFREAPQTIANLPVSPGDVMSCEITVLSPTEAAVHFVNLTTSVSTAFVKTAQLGQQLVGDCAEWILELPTGNFNGLPTQLPNFGGVYFDHCTAITRHGWGLKSGDGVDVLLTSETGLEAATENLDPTRSFGIAPFPAF
jgi:peptidase A4-like protein